MKKRVTITVDEKILKNADSIIDGIFIRNRSQAIEFLIKKSLGEDKSPPSGIAGRKGYRHAPRFCRSCFVFAKGDGGSYYRGR